VDLIPSLRIGGVSCGWCPAVLLPMQFPGLIPVPDPGLAIFQKNSPVSAHRFFLSARLARFSSSLRSWASERHLSYSCR